MRMNRRAGLLTQAADAPTLTLDPLLDNNSWADISAAADADIGASYWAVGDCKAIILDGIVGAREFAQETHYCFILGFNHNSQKEGAHRIHFMLGKDALSNGADTGLTDDFYYYDLDGVFDPVGAFCLNGALYAEGGWKWSGMRLDICGTGLTDPGLMAALPQELRAALKKTVKYTDNTGANTQAATGHVTATEDYIFLPAEYEVLGVIQYANPAEAAYQQQYAYYRNGGSLVKTGASGDMQGYAMAWWLRSPDSTAEGQFVAITEEGTASGYGSAYSLGCSPCFCL